MAEDKLSGKAGLDTTSFKTGIAGMNRELRVLESGFRASAAELGDWTKSATGLESRIGTLTSKIGIQKQKVSETRAEYERIAAEKGKTSRAAQDLEIKLNKETETLNKMEHELSDTNESLDEMRSESEDAAKGVDKLDDEMEDAEKTSGRFDNALGDMQTTMKGVANVALGVVKAVAAVAAAAGAMAIGVAIAVFKIGETLDEAYDKIIIGTGATGDKLEGLKEDFREVFANVPTDANAAASVISELNTRLGITGPILRDTSTKLLEMSRLLGGDATQNAALFARVIGDAGIPIEQSGELLDLLFKASQTTGVGIESLMEKVVQFGAPMRLMGFTLDDSIALFSKWEKEGVNAELVMGSLRIAAGKFAREGKPLRESLLDTIKAIHDTTDESQALADGMDVFGARAGPDMVAAIREGRFEIEDLLKALEGADGAILDTAEATEDWAEKFQKFKNQITLALGPAGEALLGTVGSLMDDIADIFSSDEAQQAIQEISETLQGVIEKIGLFVSQLFGGTDLFTVFEDGSTILENLFGAFGLGEEAANSLALQVIDVAKSISIFIDQIKGFIQVIVPFVTAHLPEIKAALKGIAVALAAAGIVTIIASIVAAINPVTLIIAAIVAAVGLLSAAWAGNWGGIRDILTDLWENSLQPALQALWEWLSTNIPAALATLSSYWTGTLLPAIQEVWANLNNYVFPLFRAIGEFLGAVFSVTLRNLSAIFEKTLLPIFKKIWGNLNDFVFPIFKSIGSYISDTFQPVVESLAKFFSVSMVPSFEGISNAISGVIGWLKEMADTISSLSLPAWLEPGSPTPWEIGLVGISRAMRELNQQLPDLAKGLQLQPNGLPLGTAAFDQSTSNSVQVIGNVILRGDTTPGSLGAALKGRRY